MRSFFLPLLLVTLNHVMHSADIVSLLVFQEQCAKIASQEGKSLSEDEAFYITGALQEMPSGPIERLRNTLNSAKFPEDFGPFANIKTSYDLYKKVFEYERPRSAILFFIGQKDQYAPSSQAQISKLQKAMDNLLKEINEKRNSFKKPDEERRKALAELDKELPEQFYGGYLYLRTPADVQKYFKAIYEKIHQAKSMQDWENNVFKNTTISSAEWQTMKKNTSQYYKEERALIEHVARKLKALWDAWSEIKRDEEQAKNRSPYGYF